MREVAGTLAPEQGRLRVEVMPPEASVIARRVDSASGEAPELPITPGAGALLPVGRYEVSASATGFVSASATVVVVEGGEESRVLTLDPIPTPRGRVLVSTGGVPARVRIDGVEVAETPARVDGVEVGEHRVEIVADGWLDWTCTSASVLASASRRGVASARSVGSRSLSARSSSKELKASTSRCARRAQIATLKRPRGLGAARWARRNDSRARS